MPELVLQDILVGLVGAAIATGLSWAFRFVVLQAARRRAIRRYPISGTYVSEYSDIVDGVFLRTVRDIVTIKQNVLDFIGSSRNVSSGRTFVFEGRIVDGRHLVGNYSGEQSSDSGTGVFYMSLAELTEGRIDGLWAGWGEKVAKPANGVWRWRRPVSAEIIKVTSTTTQFAGATAIAMQSEGTSFTDRSQLAELADSSDGFFIASLSPEGRPTGIALGFSSRPAIDATDRTLDLTGGLLRHRGLEIGLLQLLAVRDSYRHTGIGSKLARSALVALEKLGCDLVVTFVPQCLPNHEDLLKFLYAEGFTLLSESSHVEILGESFNHRPITSDCAGESGCRVYALNFELAELSAPSNSAAVTPRARLFKL